MLKVCRKIASHVGAYCHEPIQAYIAMVWLLFGIFIFFLGSGITVHKVPYSFEFLGQSLHGLLLIIMGLIGLYGVWTKNREADFVFAVFSTFKSTGICIELFLVDPGHPEWINFAVRMIASMILLNRAIFNISNKC
jgi:hypothetical protein